MKEKERYNESRSSFSWSKLEDKRAGGKVWEEKRESSWEKLSEKSGDEEDKDRDNANANDEDKLLGVRSEQKRKTKRFCFQILFYFISLSPSPSSSSSSSYITLYKYVQSFFSFILLSSLSPLRVRTYTSIMHLCASRLFFMFFILLFFEVQFGCQCEVRAGSVTKGKRFFFMSVFLPVYFHFPLSLFPNGYSQLSMRSLRPCMMYAYIQKYK